MLHLYAINTISYNLAEGMKWFVKSLILRRSTEEQVPLVCLHVALLSYVTLQTVVNKIANGQTETRTAFNVAQINYIFFETERRYDP